MISNVSKIALSVALAAFVSACGEKPAPKEPEKAPTSFQCKQENVLAPTWTCIPDVPGYYAGVGIADKSAAGVAHMRRVAMMNGRSDLAQQIQTQVKDKIEAFTRATGNGSAEVVDKVSTAVTKQVAKVDLKGSKAVDMWSAPSGAMYVLMTVPEGDVNQEVKKAVKTSFKNDEALWQQFQAKQALDQLDKEFPTE